MDRLNELLQELGLSKVKLAKYLGVSRQMVYNYLVLDSLDKWPKEKKVLLLQLLDIKDGSEASIKKIVVDTEYLMGVEKRLNSAIKSTGSLDSCIDFSGISKENKTLLNDFIFLLKEKLEDKWRDNPQMLQLKLEELNSLFKNSLAGSGRDKTDPTRVLKQDGYLKGSIVIVLTFLLGIAIAVLLLMNR